jgi:hypothetical protein
MELRKTPADTARTEAKEWSTATMHTVRELVAGEVDLNDPHRVPAFLCCKA